MLVNFNIEKLERLLDDFHRLTGFTVSIWDAEFNQLCFRPKEFCRYCRLIKSSPEGSRRCYLSDRALCEECGRLGAPVTHECHAGLVDTAVPIQFQSTVLGYMIFGQIQDGSKSDTSALPLRISRELTLDGEELAKAYAATETFERDKIAAAANILKLSTRYLWLSDYIKLGHETQAARINEYLQANLEKELSVHHLCRRFGISKNRLYELSHRWFGCSIGSHVTDLRVEEAKRLLSATDLPVSAVAAQVGIKDYNYFTKVFKARVSVAPLQYRKSLSAGAYPHSR